MRSVCRNCGFKAIARSKAGVPGREEFELQCLNIHCGHTWLEIVELIEIMDDKKKEK